MFRLRFPLPKYQSTFDIVPVLAYVLPLHTASISLQPLLFKASLEQRDSVVLHAVSLEEQVRAGNVRGYLQIPDFPEDPDLCPVRTLTAYFRKVRSVNFVLQIIYLCTCRCL